MNRWALFATLLMAGMLLLLALAILCGGAIWQPSDWLWLLGAALLGLLLRAMRRMMFFRPDMGLHDAFGYEIIVQCVDLMNPLMPKRAFEAIFLERETAADAAHIQAWIHARTSAIPSIALMLFAFALALHAAMLPAGALTAAALLLLAMQARAWQRQHGLGIALYLRTWLSGALVWLVECALFMAIGAHILAADQAALSYLLFTGLYESTLAPFALGLAELPALLGLFWGNGPELLGMLLAWHACRSGIVLLLAAPYAPRFKLRKRELLQPNLVRAMRELHQREQARPQHDDTQADVYLSIVIPAYNEAQRLPRYLKQVCAYARALDKPCEVIVVDDGSDDQTADRVRELQHANSCLRLVQQPRNQGKGRAVQRGMLCAKGRYLLFTDADGATPIQEADRLLARLEHSGADIVIGSRRLQASTDIERQRSGPRELLSHLFFATVNLLAVPGIHDTQCGFKLFRRQAARRLFADLREAGWAFDVEILYKAQFAGMSIEEVAVNWSEMAGSKVTPLTDAWRMLRAIFRIRRRFAGYTSASRKAA